MVITNVNQNQVQSAPKCQTMKMKLHECFIPKIASDEHLSRAQMKLVRAHMTKLQRKFHTRKIEIAHSRVNELQKENAKCQGHANMYISPPPIVNHRLAVHRRQPLWAEFTHAKLKMDKNHNLRHKRKQQKKYSHLMFAHKRTLSKLASASPSKMR